MKKEIENLSLHLNGFSSVHESYRLSLYRKRHDIDNVPKEDLKKAAQFLKQISNKPEDESTKELIDSGLDQYTIGNLRTVIRFVKLGYTKPDDVLTSAYQLWITLGKKSNNE